MQCVIYKGNKKLDRYLFVEMEDDFSRVPDSLLNILGKLEYIMSLDLQPTLKLAMVSVDEVIDNLKNQGFYLQVPPKDYIEGSVPPPAF